MLIPAAKVLSFRLKSRTADLGFPQKACVTDWTVAAAILSPLTYTSMVFNEVYVDHGSEKKSGPNSIFPDISEILWFSLYNVLPKRIKYRECEQLREVRMQQILYFIFSK